MYERNIRFTLFKVSYFMMIYLRHGGTVYVVFYNTLSWFMSELPEKDISNVGGPV